LLGHLGQNCFVILTNLVLLDPVIRESVALHERVNMASVIFRRRLMVLRLFKLRHILFLGCTLPILPTARQEFGSRGLNQIPIPVLLVIAILKKVA
jgi:hypothetical protein